METAEEREFDSILVLHVKDAEQPIALGLTKLQTFIVVKSILKQDADGNAIMISDEELIRCRDRERPLNHNLFSMRDMPEAVLADLKEWGVPMEMLEHVTSVCRTKSTSWLTPMLPLCTSIKKCCACTTLRCKFRFKYWKLWRTKRWNRKWALTHLPVFWKRL